MGLSTDMTLQNKKISELEERAVKTVQEEVHRGKKLGGKKSSSTTCGTKLNGLTYV